MTARERQLLEDARELILSQPQGCDPNPDESDECPEDANYFTGGLVLRRLNKVLGRKDGDVSKEA